MQLITIEEVEEFNKSILKKGDRVKPLKQPYPYDVQDKKGDYVRTIYFYKSDIATVTQSSGQITAVIFDKEPHITMWFESKELELAT